MLAKVPFIFDLSMQCKYCNSRYKSHYINISEPWYFVFKYLIKFVNILFSLIWLPLFIVFVFIFMTELKLALILSVGLIIVTMLFIKFRPYRLDVHDPMNERIKRIEEAKQKE